MRRRTIKAGDRFGNLTIICEAEQLNTKRRFLCACDCGTRGVFELIKLTNGNTKSCGCLKIKLAKERATKHGCSHERIYVIYSCMKRRCLNPNNQDYAHYGGRGITIHPEWLHSFASFKAWAIEKGYDNTLTIERDNVDGNYEPDNCRWIPQSDQNGNKRNSKIITIAGERMRVTEASKKFGVPGVVISNRLNCGMTAEDAVSRQYTPLGKRKKIFNPESAMP